MRHSVSASGPGSRVSDFGFQIPGAGLNRSDNEAFSLGLHGLWVGVWGLGFRIPGGGLNRSDNEAFSLGLGDRSRAAP